MVARPTVLARTVAPPAHPDTKPVAGQHPIWWHYWRDGDREGPHRAVPVLARLVASGLMRQDEVEAALVRAGIGDDQRTRMMSLFDAEHTRWTRRRSATERRIYRNLALPLLRGGKPGKLLDWLLRLADADDPAGDLRPEERRTLVMAEVAWAIRSGHLTRDHLPPGPMLPHDPLTFGDLRRW